MHFYKFFAQPIKTSIIIFLENEQDKIFTKREQHEVDDNSVPLADVIATSNVNSTDEYSEISKKNVIRRANDGDLATNNKAFNESGLDDTHFPDVIIGDNRNGLSQRKSATAEYNSESKKTNIAKSHNTTTDLKEKSSDDTKATSSQTTKRSETSANSTTSKSNVGKANTQDISTQSHSRNGDNDHQQIKPAEAETYAQFLRLAKYPNRTEKHSSVEKANDDDSEINTDSTKSSENFEKSNDSMKADEEDGDFAGSERQEDNMEDGKEDDTEAKDDSRKDYQQDSGEEDDKIDNHQSRKINSRIDSDNGTISANQSVAETAQNSEKPVEEQEEDKMSTKDSGEESNLNDRFETEKTNDFEKPAKTDFEEEQNSRTNSVRGAELDDESGELSKPVNESENDFENDLDVGKSDDESAENVESETEQTNNLSKQENDSQTESSFDTNRNNTAKQPVMIDTQNYSDDSNNAKVEDSENVQQKASDFEESTSQSDSDDRMNSEKTSSQQSGMKFEVNKEKPSKYFIRLGDEMTSETSPGEQGSHFHSKPELSKPANDSDVDLDDSMTSGKKSAKQEEIKNQTKNDFKALSDSDSEMTESGSNQDDDDTTAMEVNDIESNKFQVDSMEKDLPNKVERGSVDSVENSGSTEEGDSMEPTEDLEEHSKGDRYIAEQQTKAENSVAMGRPGNGPFKGDSMDTDKKFAKMNNSNSNTITDETNEAKQTDYLIPDEKLETKIETNTKKDLNTDTHSDDRNSNNTDEIPDTNSEELNTVSPPNTSHMYRDATKADSHELNTGSTADYDPEHGKSSKSEGDAATNPNKLNNGPPVAKIGDETNVKRLDYGSNITRFGYGSNITRFGSQGIVKMADGKPSFQENFNQTEDNSNPNAFDNTQDAGVPSLDMNSNDVDEKQVVNTIDNNFRENDKDRKEGKEAKAVGNGKVIETSYTFNDDDDAPGDDDYYTDEGKTWRARCLEIREGLKNRNVSFYSNNTVQLLFRDSSPSPTLSYPNIKKPSTLFDLTFLIPYIPCTIHTSCRSHHLDGCTFIQLYKLSFPVV